MIFLFRPLRLYTCAFHVLTNAQHQHQNQLPVPCPQTQTRHPPSTTADHVLTAAQHQLPCPQTQTRHPPSTTADTDMYTVTSITLASTSATKTHSTQDKGAAASTALQHATNTATNMSATAATPLATEPALPVPTNQAEPNNVGAVSAATATNQAEPGMLPDDRDQTAKQQRWVRPIPAIEFWDKWTLYWSFNHSEKVNALARANEVL